MAQYMAGMGLEFEQAVQDSDACAVGIAGKLALSTFACKLHGAILIEILEDKLHLKSNM